MVNETNDEFHCILLRLDESEYETVDNDSILLRRSGLVRNVVYRSGQYWIYDQSVYICSPHTDSHYNLSINSTRLVVMFSYDVLQSMLSVVGSAVSLAALLIQFIIYLVLPALRNTPGKCVMCLVVSLFVGQLLYLCVGCHAGNNNDEDDLYGKLQHLNC